MAKYFSAKYFLCKKVTLDRQYFLPASSFTSSCLRQPAKKNHLATLQEIFRTKRFSLYSGGEICCSKIFPFGNSARYQRNSLHQKILSFLQNLWIRRRLSQVYQHSPHNQNVYTKTNFSLVPAEPTKAESCSNYGFQDYIFSSEILYQNTNLALSF